MTVRHEKSAYHSSHGGFAWLRPKRNSKVVAVSCMLNNEKNKQNKTKPKDTKIMKFSGCLSLSDFVRSKPFRNPWTSAASVCIDTVEEEMQKSGCRFGWGFYVNNQWTKKGNNVLCFPTCKRNPRLLKYGQWTYAAETKLITLSQTGSSSANSRNVNLEPSHNTHVWTN